MEAALVIQLVMGLLDRGVAVLGLLQKAQAEGRDITAEELEGLQKADDLARARLVVAIADAQPKPL